MRFLWRERFMDELPMETAGKFTRPVNHDSHLQSLSVLALVLSSSLSACSGVGVQSNSPGTVTPPTGSAGPTVTFSLNPSAIAEGQSTVLTWNSTNATSCMASGAWSGSVATSGSESTGPLNASTQYQLTCTGAGGTASQSAAVTVSGGAAPPPTGLSCTGNSGSLTLKASVVRDTGVSPFLVFFDATATTDSSIHGNTTAFQDVSYSWNFGDSGVSGTDTWAYGSNKGHNSRNLATGGVAGHLYVTPGADTAYTVTVTAHSGSNTASCQLGVTAYDPAGSNGFAGTKTTCVSSSGTPVAGSGGCPAGAAVLQSSSESAVVNTSLNNKQILFKCGDTFSGGANLGGTKFSIGAYGGCQGTQTNRPIMHGALTIGTGTATDGRVADLDFESSGGYAITSGFPSSGNLNGPMTLFNLMSNGNATSYYWSQGTQWGLIDSVMTGMGSKIGTFVNYAQNNCLNGSSASNCGGSPSYNNINYQALLGNSFNGQGAPSGSSGIEVVRVSACRMCVIQNNTMENANNIGAVLKLHNGNTYNTQATWVGQYTELVEVSDNLFTGTSGAQLVETTPQNGVTDERLRNIVVERNLFAGSSTGGGRQILASAVNETLRDNVFNGTAAGGGTGAQIAQRGIEPVPQGVEFYNNTCYGSGSCAAFSGTNFAAPGINSVARNNLFYNAGTISNSGSGNTISNNTTATSNNPGFTNGSGSFKVISDYKPTANYSGGMSVPVWADAMGVAWSPTWDLGALHQ
jgi:hypothetical protein